MFTIVLRLSGIFFLSLFAEALEDIVACNYENHETFFENPLLLPPKPNQIANTKPSDTSLRAIRSVIPADGSINTFQPAAPKLSVAVSVGRKRKLLGYPAGSIMSICDESKSLHKMSPYEALKKAGHIQNLAEFLPVAGVA